MKVVFLIFSFLFLFSALNDCCLSEIEEELTKITKTTHSEGEHSDESEACEECQCSTFCSYTFFTESLASAILEPVTYSQSLMYFLNVTKEQSISESIFHPPIA